MKAAREPAACRRQQSPHACHWTVAEPTEGYRIESDFGAKVERTFDVMIARPVGHRLHFPLDSLAREGSTRVGNTRQLPAQRPTRPRRWAAEFNRAENHR
jgi:hypothetical protein